MLGCSTGKVITYAHANARFPEYHTYKIQSHQKIAEVSPRGYATYQRLDDIIAQQMDDKGYRYQLPADLEIRYEVSSGLSQNTRRSYYDRFDWYYPDTNYWERNNQQVELLLEIEMLDPHTQKIAWTGSADISLRRRDSAEEKIRLKITEILAALPVPDTP